MSSENCLHTKEPQKFEVKLPSDGQAQFEGILYSLLHPAYDDLGRAGRVSDIEPTFELIQQLGKLVALVLEMLSKSWIRLAFLVRYRGSQDARAQPRMVPFFD